MEPRRENTTVTQCQQSNTDTRNTSERDIMDDETTQLLSETTGAGRENRLLLQNSKVNEAAKYMLKYEPKVKADVYKEENQDLILTN